MMNKIKNAFFSVFCQGLGLRTILSVFAVALLLVVTSIDTLLNQWGEFDNLSYGYHTDLVLASLRSDTMEPFYTIIPALPTAGSYIEDVKSKFDRFCLIRTGYLPYIAIRIIACLFWGGMVLLVGTILVWWVLSLVFLPLELMRERKADAASFQLLQSCGLLFLNGGLWAVVGMAMSTFMESKYIAYVTPFIMYYLLVILYDRYLPNVYLLNLSNWINPEVWPYGVWGATIFLLELILVFSILFSIRARRRLQEL